MQVRAIVDLEWSIRQKGTPVETCEQVIRDSGIDTPA
jgi:hypothetical protein